MTRRRGAASMLGSPVLVGAITLLVAIVAVFLSYNANSGLPFVPTYDLKAEFSNAANLVVGNDVRIGGQRVGAVSEITPVPGDGDEPPTAEVRAEARGAGRPAAGRLDDDHPAALGARPEVHRDHARASPRRASPPATRSRRRRPRPSRSRSTTSSTPST